MAEDEGEWRGWLVASVRPSQYIAFASCAACMHILRRELGEAERRCEWQKETVRGGERERRGSGGMLDKGDTEVATELGVLFVTHGGVERRSNVQRRGSCREEAAGGSRRSL